MLMQFNRLFIKRNQVNFLLLLHVFPIKDIFPKIVSSPFSNNRILLNKFNTDLSVFYFIFVEIKYNNK